MYEQKVIDGREAHLRLILTEFFFERVSLL